jgi:hypothetical protein
MSTSERVSTGHDVQSSGTPILRNALHPRLGFLPPVLGPEDVDSVYFRATQVPRALESTQQVLHGFWPKQDARVVPTIYQRWAWLR